MPRFNKWYRAEEVPVYWEGLQAWQWDKENGVRIGVIPRGYSRETRHCGGIYFMWLDEPPPPKIPVIAEKA